MDLPDRLPNRVKIIRNQLDSFLALPQVRDDPRYLIKASRISVQSADEGLKECFTEHRVQEAALAVAVGSFGKPVRKAESVAVGQQ